MASRFFDRVKKTVYFLGRRNTFWLTIAIGSGVAAGLSEIGLTLLLQALFVSLGFIDSKAFSTGTEIIGVLSEPWILLAGLLCMISIKSFCQFLNNQASAVAQELINARLRCVAIYDLLRRQSFVSASEVNTKVGEIFPKAAQFTQYSTLAIPSLLQTCIIAGAMLYIALAESLFSFIFISMIGFIIWHTNRKVSRIASELPKEQKALTKGIERIARNWLLVRVLRTADSEFRKLGENIFTYTWKFSRARLLSNAATSLPVILGGLLIVSIIALPLAGIGSSGPATVGFLYLLVRLTQQLAVFARNYGMACSYFPHFRLSGQYFFRFSAEELREALHPSERVGMFTKKSKITLVSNTKNDGKETPLPPDIRIQNLSYSYPSQTAHVLKNINLYIKAGSQFGITGRSGSGKSTLLSIILGVFKVSEGGVSIDGYEPSDYFSRPDTRVGFVGAEPFLIEGSIRENLEYGQRKLHTEEDCWRALELARLKDVIESKPHQLEFHLKENGEGLSAGQKQRLALARAFLANPQILVLDEASANLDEETEAEIATAITHLKGKSTVLIVSHREGLLKHCDESFHLQHLPQSSQNLIASHV